MRKVHILRVLRDDCKCCSEEIEPRDEECELERVLEKLKERLGIDDSELICVCRFDETRSSKHVSYCEGSCSRGYFDILICTFSNGKCVKCIVLECKLNTSNLRRDLGGNLSDILEQLKRYNDLCIKEKNRCNCGRGPFKFIVFNRNITISGTARKRLKNAGWEILEV